MNGGSNALTVHLMGGLGNQLFQYAFGRRMVLANDATLYLDASGYPAARAREPGLGQRSCELDAFNIVATIVGPATEHIPPQQRVPRLWRKGVRGLRDLTERRKPYYARREILEPPSSHFRFDHRIVERTIRGSVSARGFWQTEKYFDVIEPQLRRELTLRYDLSPSVKRIAAEITSPNSVGIHVRHGDNASGVAASLGVLSQEYYARALTAIQRERERLCFFVFSDDLVWAKGILGDLAEAYYVEHDDEGGSHADLWLMSLCQHHILANSTFGWWGAWLGKKAGQLVYAPRRYYQNIDRPNPDLYPPAWRLI